MKKITTITVRTETKVELDMIKARLQVNNDELIQLLVKHYNKKMEV